jgi:hypothetical protein
MTTATAEAPARRSRSRLTSFRCVVIIDNDSYLMFPVAADPAVALKAWRFRKVSGDASTHDIRHARSDDGSEFVECDCRGFERWHKCRHCRVLAALGCVPAALVKRDE